MGKGKRKENPTAPEPTGDDSGLEYDLEHAAEPTEAPETDREAALQAAQAAEPVALGRYGKAYEAKRETAEGLNVRIVKWERPGQQIVGKFLGQDVLPDTKFDTPVQRYVMQTDHGTVSFLLGSATDKELEGKLRAGDLVYIEFQGQTDIGKGRSVNNFTVEKFGHEGD